MRGEKKSEWPGMSLHVQPDWTWTYPKYTMTLDKPLSMIQSIAIDPSKRLADVNGANNVWSR